MPKVSVIVPSYNNARFLPQALESALSQTYRDFEVIIIDDGSTDDTREVVERYLKRDPGRTRYIYQDNRGLACARNAGIREARGALIALLDADDQWLPERLEETVKVIGADASVGLVHANITRVDEDGTMLETPRRDPRVLSGDIFVHIFLRDAHIACPTVLFRRECCDRVGLFDENLARLGCEDRELWLRISRQYKIGYIDKVLALYRVNDKGMSRDKGKMMKARLYVIDKFCPAGGGRQKLRKKALAKVYRDLGDEFLLEKKFNDSRKQYVKAIRLNPVSVWPWINLAKALCRR